MKMKKICIGVICLSIFVITICLITIFSKDDESKSIYKGGMENVKNNVTELNILSENVINEVELATIEKISNEIEKNNNSTNDTKDDIEKQSDNENNNIKDIQSETNVTTINKEENTTKVEKNEMEKVIDDTVQGNIETNEIDNIKNKVEIKDDKKEEISNEENQEIKEEEKEENSIDNIKSVAKEKLLNSIKYSSETYRKSGNEEYKFNKSEALRVANAIIDESFKYDKLWNGENLLYKIEFKYIESIMQNSMYWPFRDTAIISSTKNKNTNGTFYIWAEDYIVNGEKIHTQYCIR